MVKEILLINDGRTLFDEEAVSYKVPLYQRPFAWGTGGMVKRDNEIVQLLNDLYDFGKGSNQDKYYLGSLVVKKRPDGSYEVIDGQQRLTALFIIFNCLGVKIEKQGSLQYESRSWAMKTLQNIGKYIAGEEVESEDVDEGIVAGIKIVQQELSLCKDMAQVLLATFNRVVLFRVEVPEGTDLNHYFEIMNTRGEQLEPQDIVKAKLMAVLPAERRGTFAHVWNICGDMDGYVQMKFSKATREVLFGTNWDVCPAQIGTTVSSSYVSSFPTLKSVLLNDGDFDVDGDEDDGEVEISSANKKPIRFYSIIDFSHFLLHVLRVYKMSLIGACEGGELDDKKLIEEFERAVPENGQGDFAWGFLECLLACRFLFDKYFVKREAEDGDSNRGKWSLKELKATGNGKKKSASYFLTKSTDESEVCNKANLMIQSCLRVSYTSPKAMHWITSVLGWLYQNRKSVSLAALQRETERLAATAVKKDFLTDEIAQCGARTGLSTPRIVFNFLDYLLWKNLGDQESPFVFEYRNSIEHWYPQHPRSDELDVWEDHIEIAGVKYFDRDYFGNLCLLTTSMNSKFSNLPPSAKARSNSHAEENGSLKYLLMIAKTKELELKFDVAKAWRKEACKEHGEEMLKVLKDGVNVSLS